MLILSALGDSVSCYRSWTLISDVLENSSSIFGDSSYGQNEKSESDSNSVMKWVEAILVLWLEAIKLL